MTRRLAVFLVLFLAMKGMAAVTDFTVLDGAVIQDGGRKKPYLVFAQETLQSLSGKTALKIDHEKWPADALITAIWLQPEGWNSKPLILLNNLDLKKELGLPPHQKWFSYDQLANNPQLRTRLAEVTAMNQGGASSKLPPLLKDVKDIGMRLATFESLAKGELHHMVPNLKTENGHWGAIAESANDELTAQFAALQNAWQTGDQSAFDKAAGDLKKSLREMRPQFFPSDQKVNTELTYQRTHPFRWAWICYAAAAIILGVTSLKGRNMGYAIGWICILAGFAFQIFGFVCRIIVAGRPPVTNMYESVVWVAFGAILFSIIFEAIYRSRYFFLGAAPLAVIALILADTQPIILNKAINPLEPVLRDNFWLTTHVLTITLSYAAFLLAMGVGHIALGTVALKKTPSAALYNYIYRSMQVGVLLLATGTILGGIWANYSWGRFWDWDPKETWALVALVTYLFVLHGRIAGLWSGFGLAVGSVLCFLSIIMAWYGVNFILGVGLHSYGFGSGGFSVMGTLVLLDLAFVGFCVYRYFQMKNARKNSGAKGGRDGYRTHPPNER